MIVVDEYLAIRSLTGLLPADLPDEPLALTTSAHWRILQRIHAPGSGQLSQALGALSPAGRVALREPVPAVLEVLDSRPMLDQAAAIAATYGNTGWHVAEDGCCRADPRSAALVRHRAQRRSTHA